MTTLDSTLENEDLITPALEHVAGFLAGAHVTASVVLGDKLGLYQSMAGAGPLSVDGLAQLVGTNPRLTREWLDSQAAAGLVAFDAGADTYALDDAFAAVLAIEDSPAFLVGAADFTRALYLDLDRVAEAMSTDGALGWGEHHDCLFSGVGRLFRPAYRANLVAEWLPALEGIVERLESGGRVADVGCGLAHTSLLLAEAFPSAQVSAIDAHPASIEQARSMLAGIKAAESIELVVADAQGYGGSFDLICFFDCLHDLGDPVGAARHAAAHLAEGGSVMVVEPFALDSRADNHASPLAALAYTGSTFVCTPNAIAQGGKRSLGAQSGEPGMRDVFAEAGFSKFRRVGETMNNIVYEARL